MKLGELSRHCLGISELPRPAGPSLFSQTTIDREGRAYRSGLSSSGLLTQTRSLHKGVQGQAQVEPPPVARPPAKSSRPFPSGYDEREPQREKCLKSVGVAA